MQFYELLLLAVGLSMDAFAVSITKGLAKKKVRLGDATYIGLWFGVFQACMPLFGFWLGSRFQQQIENVDHWVAFGILAVVGSNMIREALSNNEKAEPPIQEENPGILEMFLLAIATSIDALAVGISLALLQAAILPSVLFIGCITFAISFSGVYIGHFFGIRFQKSATLLGGAILIAIGCKIVLEHLMR